MTLEQIHEAVHKSIRVVAPAIRDVNANTALTGPDGSLDSIGFLTFLITLEDELGGRINLAGILQEGVGQDEGPFKTIGSLAALIDTRLNGR